MGRYSGKTCRMLSMLSLTSAFFVTELVVGYATNSMALIADSFHMLSDVLALVIAFVSIKMSPKEWSKNTFGWARAEVLGALVNSVFLLALCFSIFVEALNRLYDPTGLRNPVLILIVGSLGLLINIIGLILFAKHGHGHGHSHGGHGHSHGGHGHAHKNKEQFLQSQHQDPKALKTSSALETPPPRDCEIGEGNVEASGESKVMSSSQMNMRGVFLHVLSDAIGSIIVIISALIVMFTNWEYSIYIDPVLSLCLVLLITFTTWPLLRDSALVLLQTVPTHIKVDGLAEQLRRVEGVAAVHEFHVWQLAGDRIIASAHIRFRSRRAYMTIAEEIKTMFHQEGIHSTTIQPEFDDERPWENGGEESPLLKEVPPADSCILDCPSSERKLCAVNTCCGVPKKKSSNSPPVSFAYDNAVALEEAAAEERGSPKGTAPSTVSCCSPDRGTQAESSSKGSRKNSAGHSSIYDVRL
ncbi:uncharacterized protein LOC143040161 [Oratosquilla oratoria]|uniref:uncharacterized protein LOC143040161 n=1 Tax=Oratosquilla oratoria TaxID=337810 RepID=UPI003F765470